MGYQVLARKWRPLQFCEVVGQSHVLTALGNALDNNRLHHAYLFSGTRGVGKTTIARILAKGLNCEQGVSSAPCGVCSSCLEIDQGRFVDLLEIDAASRTKVEDTRELLDNVQYKPARGRYKVYLIDEVHMLSRHSFNALLKTLEEPPEYVKFILATTDPQKLPVTILSRCLQFHLKHLNATQIKDQLQYVLEQESVTVQPRALSLIARAAEGSMRDALSLTDQAIALGNGHVFEDQVIEMLGTLSSDQAILLLEALSEGQASPIMQSLSALAEIGVEWDGLLKEVAAQLHVLAMAQALPESVDAASPDAPRILALAKKLTPQDVQLFYQIALQGRQDLPFAPDGRAGLEMVLLRMLAFRPVTSSEFEPFLIQVPHIQPNLVKPPESSSQLVTQNKIASLKAQMSSARAGHIQPSALVERAPIANDLSISDDPSVPVFEPGSFVGSDVKSLDFQQQEPPHFQQELPQGFQQPQDHLSQSASGTLMAARNTLRSRRVQEGAPVKKDKSVLLEGKSASVFERLTEKNTGSRSEVSSISNIEKKPKEDAYRWTATQNISVDEPQVVTPEKIKHALMHDRTSEMREKLERESCKRDEWSRISNELVLPQLVKQMALNASMEIKDAQVFLFLRPSHAHLNKDKAKKILEEALSHQRGFAVSLSIEISDKGISPLEWRDNIYTEKLSQANESLRNDPNVGFLCQRFSAEIDEDSVRPI